MFKDIGNYCLIDKVDFVGFIDNLYEIFKEKSTHA